ncbi:MAG: M23 family metallopeptidase [Pseudomonadota bacterium]
MPQPPSFTAGEFTQGGWARIQLPSRISEATFDGEPVEVSADGRLLVAFDRDSGPKAELKYDGFTSVIPITPRQWQISRVNVPKRAGGSSEAWWKKRKPEWEAIVAARAKETDAQGWRQDFIWPVKGRISGLFGRQRIYQGEPGSYHSGIDIAPGHGVPFVAPADGVVVLARTGFSLEGGLIIIDHGGGLNSAFLHSSKILVKEGQAVKQGERIGHVGSTGRSTGPHLHWSLKWNDARLDPLLFTGPMGS